MTDTRVDGIHDHGAHSSEEPTGLGRREMLRRGGMLFGSFAVGSAVLAACGKTDASSSSATTAAAASGSAPPGTQAPTLARPDTPAAVADALRAGNERFMADTPLHPNQGSELRHDTVTGQAPFAAVLGCADSRVEPTLIFDQGFGDLFVVRNAGNITEATSAASLAYAVEHLGVGVIVVLGHESCGAVTAAVEASDGATEPPEFHALTDPIQPAVAAAKASGTAHDQLVATSVVENVKLQATSLPQQSSIIREAVDAGHLVISTAVYELGSGRATLSG